MFLAWAWTVLLLAAPAAALGGLASALTYAIGSFICHQRPERSFYIDAAQLPVCARCFGLYAGAALGLIAGLKPCATLKFCATLPSNSTFSRWRSPSGLRRLVIAAAIPTMVTWSSEMLGIWSPANLTRFIAALPLGAAVAVTVNYLECARRQPTEPRPPRIPI